MSSLKSSYIVCACLIAKIILFANCGIDSACADDAQKQPTAKISIDAGIVPQPGEEIAIAAEFDMPMDRKTSPRATLSIGKAQPQSFTKGKWNTDGTKWTFRSPKLGSAKGLGQLIVEDAKAANGQPMLRHQESFLVGKEPILAKLEEIGRWMLDHRHEFIFVEGYDYRTLLALYEITGKQVYLDAARKGAENLLKKQQPYGHWGTGYGSIYLADTGSALGLFINLYQFATPKERKKIDEAFQRYCEMVLVKGDGTGKPFVHKEGCMGIGFKDIKDGKVVGPMNRPYTISTSLSGAELFAALYYMHGNKKYKQIATKAADWLLATRNDEGVFPYIIDDWDRKREKIWKNYLYGSSTYTGEGLIAAWSYLDDPALRKRIEKTMGPHIGWLLRTQNVDGSWGKDKTFNSTRGHGVINVLSWYYNRVKKDPLVAQAIRRYYLLLLDKDRKSYQEVARHPLHKWKWKVAGEYVSSSLAGRALAEIVKPDVDCYRWKDKTDKKGD